MGQALHSGTPKAKERHASLMQVALFWKPHCVACVHECMADFVSPDRVVRRVCCCYSLFMHQYDEFNIFPVDAVLMLRGFLYWSSMTFFYLWHSARRIKTCISESRLLFGVILRKIRNGNRVNAHNAPIDQVCTPIKLKHIRNNYDTLIRNWLPPFDRSAAWSVESCHIQILLQTWVS